MKDKFNRYCAEVVYPEAEISISSRECNLLFPREDPFKYGTVIYNYNPYDDLNQMAEAVDPLICLSINNGVMWHTEMLRVAQGEKEVKQAFRDFIVSTKPAGEDDEKQKM